MQGPPSLSYGKRESPRRKPSCLQLRVPSACPPQELAKGNGGSGSGSFRPFGSARSQLQPPPSLHLRSGMGARARASLRGPLRGSREAVGGGREGGGRLGKKRGASRSQIRHFRPLPSFPPPPPALVFGAVVKPTWLAQRRPSALNGAEPSRLSRAATAKSAPSQPRGQPDSPLPG